MTYMFETIFQERINYHRVRADYHRASGHPESWALGSLAKAAKWEARSKEFQFDPISELILSVSLGDLQARVADEFLNGNNSGNQGIFR